MLARLTRDKFTWITVILLGLLAGGILGWRLQSGAQAHELDNNICPEWNPTGAGSWGPAESLPTLIGRSDLLIKGTVVGHGVNSDTFDVNGATFNSGFLINQLEVEDILKGNVQKGETIHISGVDICLGRGETYYIFLTEPEGGYSTEFTDNPNRRDFPSVYYILHYLGQWRVKDNRVEHIPDLLQHEEGFDRFHRMPEAAFVGELRQSLLPQ